MVVTGFGLGMTFPVFSLAVQNAVPYRVMGIAMSSLQFFRTLGGMMGTAILGALMTNTFRPEFERRAEAPIAQLAAIAQSIPPQVAQQLPPQAVAGLRNPAQLFANPLILLSPEAMGQLRASFQRFPGGEQILSDLLVALRGSLAVALDHTFLIGCGILSLAFIVSLFLGERPLRKTNRPDVARGERPGEPAEWSPAAAAEQAAVPPAVPVPAREPVPAGD